MGYKAKKSLGQHFLKSEKALMNIVNAAEVNADDIVLEIGPGQGALTDRLIMFAGKVIAVEKDLELYKELKKKYEKLIEAGLFDLICDDILSFDPNLLQFYEDFNYKLVANIPYNITGAIFKKFLSAEYQPAVMVLLIQKEVAERIVARDGKESILSISVKAYGRPRYVTQVKVGSFVPVPSVDSAILAVENISKDFFQKMAQHSHLGVQLLSVEVEKKFFEMVRVGFSSKRKKLSSNLSGLYPKEKVLKAFLSLGLDPNTRAEDVSIQTWQKLALALI